MSILCMQYCILSQFTSLLFVSSFNLTFKFLPIASMFKHSHKKRKDSLETRAILIEIFMLCWNLPSGPKHWGWLQKKKTLLSLKEISCLQMIFVLIWAKQTLIWFNLQRYGIANGFSNIKDTFVESLQLQMSVPHQSMSIFQSSRLVT